MIESFYDDMKRVSFIGLVFSANYAKHLTVKFNHYHFV